jgi:hypothetical protein
VVADADVLTVKDGLVVACGGDAGGFCDDLCAVEVGDALEATAPHGIEDVQVQVELLCEPASRSPRLLVGPRTPPAAAASSDEHIRLPRLTPAASVSSSRACR